MFLLALFLISTSLTLWGFWPPERETREIPLQLADTSTSSALRPQWALPEERTLRLEFSPSPRLGDAQIIQLRIFPVSTSAETNSIDEAYTVIAEARLDMPLAEVRPAGVISAALVEGGSATFYWEVSPRVGGDVDGTVWTYLRFIPRDGGAEIRQTVAAQVVAIRPRSVLGRTGSEARFWGVFGLLAGIVLGWLSLRRGRPALGAK